MKRSSGPLVSNVPQTMAFTRIPRDPNSLAAALVSAFNPAFAAAYPTIPPTACTLAPDEMRRTDGDEDE